MKMRYTFLMLLHFCFIAWMPLSAQPPAECPAGLPTRLFPNADGRVIVDGGVPLNYQPSTESFVLRQVAQNSEFIAWYGPACVGDAVWWMVDDHNGMGWIMESSADSENYFVEPLDDMIEDLAPRPRAGDDPLTVDELGLQFELSANIAGSVDVHWVPSNLGEAGPDFAVRPLRREVNFLGYVGSEQEVWLHIRVYEADAWDSVSIAPIDDLRTLLDEHPDAPALTGLAPINAGRLLTTLVAYQDFQNGQGVRGIVRYAQAPIPVADGELIYLFAGLTDDRKYLVHVAFPLDSALIPTREALDERFNASLFFDYDYQIFNSSIATMLTNAPDEMFRPRLSDIDALIASLHVGEAPELCGELPSRLEVDDTVRQALENDPLRVRDTANGEVIESFFPGEEGIITAGPECIDGIVWWQVIHPDAWVGWVAETQGDRYFLEPVDD